MKEVPRVFVRMEFKDGWSLSEIEPQFLTDERKLGNVILARIENDRRALKDAEGRR